MKYKINEIFYSIQGEGFNTGIPAIFIRFAGCNFQCSFCDTNYSEKYELDEKQIVNEIIKYKCKNIIFTGGEATEQDLLPLLYHLTTFTEKYDYRLFLETNGTNRGRWINYFNWITVSPKDKNYIFTFAHELKLVYTGQSEEEIEHYYNYSNARYNYLQPEGNKPELIESCIEYIKRHTHWRLSCQVQKLINIK